MLRLDCHTSSLYLLGTLSDVDYRLPSMQKHLADCHIPCLDDLVFDAAEGGHVSVVTCVSVVIHAVPLCFAMCFAHVCCAGELVELVRASKQWRK